MTNEEHDQFVKVMVDKYLWQAHAYPTREEAIESIIGGVVSDTSLLMDGTVPLDRWLQPTVEASK